MSRKVRLTADCDALGAPHERAERLFHVREGSELALLRDDDRDYYKIACSGTPVYVLKAKAVVEEGDPSSDTTTITRLDTRVLQPSALHGALMQGHRALQLVATVIFVVSCTPIILAIALPSDDPDPLGQGLAVAFGWIALLWGTSLALILLAFSVYAKHAIRWSLLAVTAWLLMPGVLLSIASQDSDKLVLMILVPCVAGLLAAVTLLRSLLLGRR